MKRYLPWVVGVTFGTGLALMPVLWDMTAWTYVVTVPMGVAGGFAAFMAVFLATTDE